MLIAFEESEDGYVPKDRLFFYRKMCEYSKAMSGRTAKQFLKIGCLVSFFG